MTLAIIAPTLALIGVAIQPHIGGAENERNFPALNQIANFIALHAFELCAFTVLCLLISWTTNFTLTSLQKGRRVRQILTLGVVDERWALFLSAVAVVCSLGFGIYFGQSAFRKLLDVVTLSSRL
jgi:hypothetical protein